VANDERYQVENPEIERALKTLAGDIDEHCPDGWGFTLFLFSYGKDGSIFYISSAERASMRKTIQEWLAKEEKANGHANG
jgi:hypothetical protein